jgi:hypothetical protein
MTSLVPAAPILDGRYRLGRLIGRGGMSDVYRAVDEQNGQQVAIKIVRSNDAPTAARLAREARALESMGHPNLVRLLDSGVVDTRAYLVMTYVDGSTLEARLRGGRLAPGAAASLGAAVADALAYIHARGIVHRDVKPANILVTPGGDVKLADFGVARLADASALTIAGSTLGTVAYMAPEQLDNHQVGSGADMWSLGMVLLEALTGRRVYTGAPSEVVARRLAQPVPIPDDLPSAWQSLLSGMLARSPELRPDAGDVARQLRGAAFSAPWDPWGRPLAASGGTTVPLSGETGGGRDRTDAYSAARHPAPPPPVPFRWRRAALVGLVAVVTAVLVAVWALGGGSGAGKSSPAQAPASSAPPAPTAAGELAALTGHVTASVAAGSLSTEMGGAVTGDARQAISAAAGGSRTQAATDIQRALTAVASGVPDGSITTAAAGLLNADLTALATTLGISAATVPSSTAPPASPAAREQPPRHNHHGNGKGDGG